MEEKKSNQQTVDPRLIEKAQELIKLKSEYAAKQEIADEVKKDAKQSERELISLMEGYGFSGTGDKFGCAEIGTIVRRERFSGKITDMELAEKLFEEAGIHSQVLQLKPVKRRLNEFIKELLRENKQMPGLDFYVEPYISIQKS